MNMDKNYFLTRLANGEDINAIGQDIADMMNAAVAEHKAQMEAEKAKVAKAEQEAAKRELIEEMIEIVQELAILEGMDEDDLKISEEDMDHIVKAFGDMFATMRNMKKLVESLDTKKVGRIAPAIHKSDDQILAEFAKMFS